MNSHILVLFGASLLTTNPSLTFASGSEGASRPTPAITPSFYSSSSQSRSTNFANHVVIAEEPYNVGKALFSGNYHFGKPKLTTLNIEEKKQRLAALRKGLPAEAQNNFDPPKLAQHLTNREANALEYYIRMRFKKFLSNSPTWAKEEPQPKVASSR